MRDYLIKRKSCMDYVAPVVVPITTQTAKFTTNDVEALLLSFEARLERNPIAINHDTCLPSTSLHKEGQTHHVSTSLTSSTAATTSTATSTTVVVVKATTEA